MGTSLLRLTDLGLKFEASIPRVPTPAPIPRLPIPLPRLLIAVLLPTKRTQNRSSERAHSRSDKHIADKPARTGTEEAVAGGMARTAFPAAGRVRVVMPVVVLVLTSPWLTVIGLVVAAGGVSGFAVVGASARWVGPAVGTRVDTGVHVWVESLRGLWRWTVGLCVGVGRRLRGG